MPTRPATADEVAEAELFMQIAAALDPDDSDEEDVQEMFLFAACEPAVKRLRQEIGGEKLSIERLRREAAAAGIEGDDISWNVYQKFGFHLADLPTVVDALDVPDEIKTESRHGPFTGEEAVLLMLMRFRSTSPLLSMTKETGRNISALSEIVTWMVEHIHRK